jgi:hypothetical protein
MSARTGQIQQALQKLESFRKDPVYANQQYAIDANIVFLNAARSLPGYIWWLFFVAPKLDGSRLLELTDFPVEEWDVEMHSRLIEMQRRKNPGLITPLVNAITEYIQSENRDLIIADLGAGGMEVDRQVIEWALKTNHPHALTIVAVDKSSITRKIADKNLKEFAEKAEIVEVGEITAEDLKRMREKSQKKILVVMCTNDIFELANKFPPKHFDLVYHSLFRHHLNLPEQEKLDQACETIAKQHIELDGYKSWPVMLPQAIVGWNYPHFLNGEVFSNLRFRGKKDVVQYTKGRGVISFYGTTGFYLLKYYK